MKRKILFAMTALLAIAFGSYSQSPIVLTVSQAAPMVVSAGTDKAINKGESIPIGGSPSASLGYGTYVYLWSPATGLDDPTLANPMAAPAVNTTYLLTVTDANNCSATDEVAISVDASGIEANPSGLKIRCYPNPVEDELMVEITGPQAVVNIRLIDPIAKTLVLQVTRMAGNGTIERIPMQKFPAGIYYLQLITEKSTYYQPIVKTR